MISTTYAMRKGYKPIDFFYRSVVDVKTKKVKFVDAFQILNDRYVGRMNVMNYFFIAENSVRINELNLIALDELKNYNQVMRENFYIPDVVYSLPLTTRFLGSDRDLEILQATLREKGYKKGQLVIAFNANTLMALPKDAKIRYDRLRRMGYKTCVYGIGEEFNELDLFARYNFDYLRCEAVYFDATPAKKRLLAMLVKYCKANKMTIIMEGVDTPSQVTRFKKEGIMLYTGKAVAKLTRWVTRDILGLPGLKPEQREEYIKKLEAEKAEAKRKEELAKEKARLAQIDKAKKDAEAGRVIAPEQPKPELTKSPYQVRLEKQKAAAKRAEEIRAVKKAEKAELFDVRKEDRDTKRERKLYEEVASSYAKESSMFGDPFGGTLGGVGGFKLNLGKTAPKYKSKDAELIISEPEEEEVSSYESEKVLGEGKAVKEYVDEKKADAEDKAREEAEAKAKEERIKAKLAAREAREAKEKEEQENSTQEDAVENLVVEEQPVIENEVVDNSVQETVEENNENIESVDNQEVQEEEDEPKGHYNEKHQWVDENGNVYNGYWDENGNWVDYEEFDELEEGHYNDKGQWVAADGTVYNGYYDEQGRWIDYSYQNEDGEWVDNGYFDERIGKWVPYGYFDEEGVWHNF